MRRPVNILLTVALIVMTFVLTACQSNQVQDSEKDNDSGEKPKEVVLKVGASPEPHARMLELVKDDLKKEGITLEIQEFSDYVQPNLALDGKQLDANFFQHLPYLESFNKENNLDLVSLGSVHLEPMGVYSEKIDKIQDLKEGSNVTIPNDATNGARALLILEKAGLIKLKEDAGFNATEKDIVENPKKLKFQPLDAAALPRTLKDVDISVINGNFALQASLDPLKDALVLEENSSPYGNIIAIRKGEEDRPELKALLKALQSDEIKKYIEDEFKGGVIPAF